MVVMWKYNPLCGHSMTKGLVYSKWTRIVITFDEIIHSLMVVWYCIILWCVKEPFHQWFRWIKAYRKTSQKLSSKRMNEFHLCNVWSDVWASELFLDAIWTVMNEIYSFEMLNQSHAVVVEQNRRICNVSRVVNITEVTFIWLTLYLNMFLVQLVLPKEKMSVFNHPYPTVGYMKVPSALHYYLQTIDTK